MKDLQSGLDLLTEKYNAGKAEISADGRAVNIDGKTYPLLTWESERRFAELKDIFQNRLGNICTYRISHIAKRGTDLRELLIREAGVMEYTLGSKATKIFSIAGGESMNCIITAENGGICTIELAATLEESEEDIDKHEIITDAGIACDMVVDTQVPQESIYVFGKNAATYRDTDAELYGYSADEITAIRTAFALAKFPERRDAAVKQYVRLQRIAEASDISLATLSEKEVCD